MPHSKIKINHAPVLNLWAAVVAERLGYKKGEALSISKALTGKTAQKRGKELGVYEESDANETKARREKTKGAQPLRFMGKEILVVDTPEGLRAVSRDKPIEPDTVEKYLKSKFGDALPEVRSAMEALAKSVTPRELRVNAYRLYGQFTPDVPAGIQGWGAKGELDVERIRRIAKKIKQ